MKSYLDIQYYLRVYLGNGTEFYDLLFDTGSSWIWVPEATIKSSKFPNRYNCSQSLSCTDLN